MTLGYKLHPVIIKPIAQPPQQTGHTYNNQWKNCSIYFQLCLGCGFAGMYVGEVSARIVYILAFKAP